MLRHIITHQGRRSIKTDWRQLGRITYKNHFALRSGTHERNQVIKKVSSTEGRCRLLLSGINAYQRRLIDNEEGILVLIRRKRELAESVTADRLLPVNMFMDSECRLTGIGRKHLGSTTCGSKKDALCLILFQERYHRRNCCSLSRTGISVHYKNIRIVTADKIRYLAQKCLLTGSRSIFQTGDEPCV